MRRAALTTGRMYGVLHACAGLLFAGTVLRASLVIEDGGTLLTSLLLLLAWLILFVSEIFISRRWRFWSTVYLVMQTGILVALLSAARNVRLLRHAFRRTCHVRAAPISAVGRCCLGGALHSAHSSATERRLRCRTRHADPHVHGRGCLLGCYALASRRAEEARVRNQALATELEAANTELRDYSSRLERLAVAQERNRLARELHDSVTQTIFSMTLASQSAAILFEREPDQVDTQLERLGELTKSALAEMHVLISELTPTAPVEGGLAAAMRSDIQRRGDDGLEVSLEVEEPARPMRSNSSCRPRRSRVFSASPKRLSTTSRSTPAPRRGHPAAAPSTRSAGDRGLRAGLRPGTRRGDRGSDWPA